MKPVVSSLVALAIAIAPLSAVAKPAHSHKSHAKVVKHGQAVCGEKIAKADKEDEKADKEQKSEKSPLKTVKTSKKDGALLKKVTHHAHNVDLGGAGHGEPKAEHGGNILVQASLKTESKMPAAHGKEAKMQPKMADKPRLPDPNAGKPSKGGAEKGARKPAEKKSESADDGSGEPARDEDFAELVARIRGRHVTSNDGDKTDVRDDAPRANPHTAKTDAKAREGTKKIAHRTSEPPCAKDPVEIVRGPEVERFALTKCDGTVAPLAVEHLSILVRPGSAARPTAPLAELAKKPGNEIAPRIRRVDPRLIERIQSVVDHFGKPGEPAKLFVISGYRPTSVGSMHSTGRAIDFRVEGTKNEDVVAFCKTLSDTGCGFYPNSSFVHVDVRDAGAGHVTWIDASGPGEAPRYVSQWPPPAAKILNTVSLKTTDELAAEGEAILRAQRPEATETTEDEHPLEAGEDKKIE